MTLQEIETKIAALEKRYTELDAKLVPKFDGVIDFTVSDAMNRVKAEIDRLQKQRERVLVDDLIDDEVSPNAQVHVATKRVVDPLPDSLLASGAFEISDDDPFDQPIGDLLDSTDNVKQLSVQLTKYTATELARTIEAEGRDFDAARERGYAGTQKQWVTSTARFKESPVRYTWATHNGFFISLVKTVRDMRLM